MPAAVESMFSHRETPWHGIGKITDHAPNSAEAIIEAGLDWTVEKRPMYTLNAKENKIRIPGSYAMVRGTDDMVLGQVKEQYIPFQNVEAFGFTDSIVGEGLARYETAGSLRGGKVVFLTMKMPDHIMVGGEDRHDLYILFMTSHDGSRAISVYLTPIRVVCMNTLILATKGNHQRWSMRHVNGVSAKIEEARETLKLTSSYVDEFKSITEDLLRVKVDRSRSVELLESVLPVRPKTEERILEIADHWLETPTNGYTGTGWGLMNSLTEYFEHGRERTELEATFHNAIYGDIHKMRNKLKDAILATA